MRRVVLAAAALICALALPAYAGEPAGTTGGGVVVRSVDSTDPRHVTVTFEYAGDPQDVAGTNVSEAGQQLQLEQPPTALPGAKRALMFVVDASSSTDGTAILAEAQEAVQALAAKLSGVPVGLVSAGTQATLDQRFTTDINKFGTALTSVDPQGDGTLWEGVDRAVGQFTGEDSLPTVIVITDGVQRPTTTFTEAMSAVANAGAEVHVVGVQRGGIGDEVRGLAERSGGAYIEVGQAADLTTAVDQLTPRLTGQYQLTYASGAEDGLASLSLTVGQATSRNSFVPGSVQRGIAALAYEHPSTGGAGVFAGNIAKLVGVLGVLVAAGLAAFALINLAVKDENSLASVLSPYDGYDAVGADEDGGGTQSLAQSALLQRAVAMTEQFAQRQGFLTKVEAALERANLPIRAAEAMFFYAAAAGVITLLALALSRQLVIAGGTLVVAILLPPAIINVLATRRKKKFEGQLPDMLQLMAATLRAGYSMQQALDAVSQEVSEPMGREMRRATTEARLGRPLEEALDAVAERMGSADFGWAVMAIRIQREVGGNLAELLMTVSDTMTQRERLRREVRALTAEGRMSAYVLGILPIALAAILWMINPGYMQPLLDESLGNMLLAGAAIGMIGGFAWMSKIVKVEI